MLNVTATVRGDRVVFENLEAWHRHLPKGVEHGLSTIARHVFRQAHQFLSGVQKDPPGSWPVPVRTGHLRRSLNWLEPGESKTTEAGTFEAGPLQAVVYDSAIYAYPIHEGRGSSAKFQSRPYLTEALKVFARGDRIATTMNKAIRDELKRVSKGGKR